MKYDKIAIRKKFLLKRKKRLSAKKNFPFHLIFKLIRKHFSKKKITIAGYYPSNNEVNVLEFLKTASEKKFRIVLPIVRPKNILTFNLWQFNDPLTVNDFGILEPMGFKKKLIPDLVIAPLVAFDKNLNRIGYGKGYYDRALNRIKKNIIVIGMAYSFQEFEKIPTNKHDFKLHYIFTEEGIIYSAY